MAASPISQGLTLLLLLHRVLAGAHTAWVIVLARPPATPSPAGKARLSAHRGVVLGVEESEAEVLGNPSQGTLTCPLSSIHWGLSWGFSLPGAVFPPTALCYPQTIIRLPGQQDTRSWSPRCPGHSPDMPITLASSLRQAWAEDRKQEKTGRELLQGGPETKASWSKQPVMGWVPWLKGLSQAGLPWEQADWRLLSPPS